MVLENFFFGVWAIFAICTAITIYVINRQEHEDWNRLSYSIIWTGIDCLIADLIVKGFYVHLGMTEFEALGFTFINWLLILCFFIEEDIYRPYRNKVEDAFQQALQKPIDLDLTDGQLGAFIKDTWKFRTWGSKYIIKKSFKSY